MREFLTIFSILLLAGSLVYFGYWLRIWITEEDKRKGAEDEGTL